MSDTDLILQALKEHREETRQDLHELRAATVKVADAAAEMGKNMARSEARHMQHEDGMKRIGKLLDDHEVRIRTIEADRPAMAECRRRAEQIETIQRQLSTSRGSINGAWKVLTVIGALIVSGVGVVTALIKVVA